ncbi:hypothetical protein KQ302_07225 [Synechococcus sp. CS-602]|nr:MULTISPECIES: hypothetical protein [Synechococcaceae]MCT4364028.1 hypothetical protein [Candidatus Regnicoccus frigidus MAG-AL1]MCT0202258.1 hypothetical protein [Synechococcus sp. CS-603]MCT0204892.1 hypothetical protein [Synechococcus sp. CS-602]MCT0245848.1 hypothetical protein [Synechococcus sp. CS-601]MCT4368723.1 hypothetical protein [Candidatus Regnicoccus frigidus MAG-AL2]
MACPESTRPARQLLVADNRYGFSTRLTPATSALLPEVLVRRCMNWR